MTLFVHGRLKKFLQVELQLDRKKKQPVVDLPKGPESEPVKAPPFQGPILFDDTKDQEGEVGDGVYQLPDEELPDTKKFLSKRLHFPVPKLSDCRKMKKIDLKKFASSWLSLAAKKINVKNYIDFKSKPTGSQQEPVCNDLELPTDLIIDLLPALMNRGRLDYSAETGLRMVLRKAEGVSESIENAGPKIAAALRLNSTSWVAAKIASLYWRVKGRAQEALECLRVALAYAPDSAKDTIFISVANVLHRAGYVNDAIMTMSYALQSSRDVVVSQFTMANLYAAKEQWSMATMFYESTLALQADFQPAKDRLRTIQCMKVLKRPELYEDEDPNIHKYVIT